MQRHYFAYRGPYSKLWFSRSHVRVWELAINKDWAPKNWCLRTLVLEKTLESPLDSNKIKSVNLEGNQLWIFIARADAEAEAPTLWPPDGRANSLEKTLMLGKIKGRRRRGRQRMRCLDGLTDLMDVSLTKLWEWWRTGKPGVLLSLGSQRVGHNWATEQQPPFTNHLTFYNLIWNLLRLKSLICRESLFHG